jgi:hypothetical protein
MNLSQYHFVHYKSNTDYPGIKPLGPDDGSATNRLSHGTGPLGPIRTTGAGMFQSRAGQMFVTVFE